MTFHDFTASLLLAALVAVSLGTIQSWIVFAVTKNPGQLKLASMGIAFVTVVVFVGSLTERVIA